MARVVLIAGGFTGMLVAGMGARHYLILLFAAAGLAATMPVKPGVRLFPRRLSPIVAVSALAVVEAVVLVCVFGHVTERLRFVIPPSPQRAAAAFSPDSVNRDPALARACPPGSKAMVWGYAAEIYVAQDWQSTLPYLNVGTLSMGDNRESAEPIVRAGINRADCIIDATLMKRAECPDPRPEQLGWCLSERFSLPRIYPQLVPVIGRQFHTVPLPAGAFTALGNADLGHSGPGGWDGCTLYVRNVSW